MAFMMPVMRNDYNIYASRSRTSSSSSIVDAHPPHHPRVNGRRSASESAPVSLSCSPGSDLEERLAAVSLGCSPRRNSTMPVLQDYTATSPPRTGSQSSLTKFHSRVVEKLRRKLRPKEDSESSKGVESSTSPTS